MSDDVQGPVRQGLPEGYQPLDWTRGFGRQIGPLYRRITSAGTTTGFRVEAHHTNGLQNTHGGMLMTLADMAWGNVVSFERSRFWVTVRLTCDFLAPAQMGDWVEGGGELLSAEDGLYVVRGRLWSDERTLMVGSGVFKALGPREPRPGEKQFLAQDIAVA
jgi:acyl-coenzyme A thioesterase PaaI-like protein